MQLLKADTSQALSREYSWLDGGQSYVVCAFYTPDYVGHVLALKQSLELLGINFFLKCYEPTESWEANTRIKPQFIAHCLTTLRPKHVLYVDADAIVKQPLHLLDEITTDLAIVIKSKIKQLRITVGTIYVRNTPAGQRFIEEWLEGGRECGQFATDSELFHRIVGRSVGFSFTALPPSYAARNDGPFEAVIQHFRVSKQTKIESSLRRKARTIWTALGGRPIAYF